MLEKKFRILYLVSHPIQYHAPLLRLISADSVFDLLTLFYWDKKQDAGYDAGFQQNIKWDIPLLDGYRSEFLCDVARSNNTFLKLIALWKLLRKKDYDILWTHGYADIYTLSAIIFSQLKSIKVFVRGESVIFEDQKKHFFKKVFRRIFFWFLDKCVDRYLAIGTLNKKFYMVQNIFPDKIFLAPYTVDNHFFYQKYCDAKNKILDLKNTLNLNPAWPVILYASKFIIRKYPIDLLQAFQKLNGNAYLLFIGTGETLEHVKNVAAQKKSQYVHFLGFKNQTELADYFALSDIIVLPSKHENWGLIINEAMNAECAIVVSDEVGCAIDLVKPGENGFIYPARDIDVLTKCLQTLIDDPALCEKMQFKSREIISHWSFTETIDGLKAACESL